MKYLIYKLLKKLLKEQKINFETIMANIQTLKQQVAELQAAVDAEQAQIAILVEGQQSTIVALEAEIDRLQALVDAAPTPEEIQSVVDNLTAIKDDVAQTVAEASTTTSTTEEETSTTETSTEEDTSTTETSTAEETTESTTETTSEGGGEEPFPIV